MLKILTKCPVVMSSSQNFLMEIRSNNFFWIPRIGIELELTRTEAQTPHCLHDIVYLFVTPCCQLRFLVSS